MPRTRRKKPPLERLMARVIKTADGCWNWDNPIRNGYGAMTVDDQRVYTHRLAYELLVGPIPEGMQIDHLCRNTACCNPDHLEPVTHRENQHRGNGFSGINARKTRCPAGHEYTPENTYIDGSGWRDCRACNRARSVRNYARSKAA